MSYNPYLWNEAPLPAGSDAESFAVIAVAMIIIMCATCFNLHNHIESPQDRMEEGYERWQEKRKIKRLRSLQRELRYLEDQR